jgi:hypothetical protein
MFVCRAAPRIRSQKARMKEKDRINRLLSGKDHAIGATIAAQPKQSSFHKAKRSMGLTARKGSLEINRMLYVGAHPNLIPLLMRQTHGR